MSDRAQRFIRAFTRKTTVPVVYAQSYLITILTSRTTYIILIRCCGASPFCNLRSSAMPGPCRTTPCPSPYPASEAQGWSPPSADPKHGTFAEDDDSVRGAECSVNYTDGLCGPYEPILCSLDGENEILRNQQEPKYHVMGISCHIWKVFMAA